MAPMGDYIHEKKPPSVSGEMIYPLSVLKPIRHVCDVILPTDTIDRGITNRVEIIIDTKVNKC